jgi:hypothetical protein
VCTSWSYTFTLCSLSWRFYVVVDHLKTIYLLLYKNEQGLIEERARDYCANCIMTNDIYLGVERDYSMLKDYDELPPTISVEENHEICLYNWMPMDDDTQLQWVNDVILLIYTSRTKHFEWEGNATYINRYKYSNTNN